MKHLPDDQLLGMLGIMKIDRGLLGAKIERVYEALSYASDRGHRIRTAVLRWRHQRLLRVYETLSAEIRRFSREARARSLRGYKGQGT